MDTWTVRGGTYVRHPAETMHLFWCGVALTFDIPPRQCTLFVCGGTYEHAAMLPTGWLPCTIRCHSTAGGHHPAPRARATRPFGWAPAPRAPPPRQPPPRPHGSMPLRHGPTPQTRIPACTPVGMFFWFLITLCRAPPRIHPSLKLAEPGQHGKRPPPPHTRHARVTRLRQDTLPRGLQGGGRGGRGGLSSIPGPCLEKEMAEDDAEDEDDTCPDIVRHKGQHRDEMPPHGGGHAASGHLHPPSPGHTACYTPPCPQGRNGNARLTPGRARGRDSPSPGPLAPRNRPQSQLFPPGCSNPRRPPAASASVGARPPA
jgi:hypothetical protein